jgi:hypothetical protein
VKEHLGKKFPNLAPGGKYYQQSKALAIGLQVLQQQEEEAEEKKKLETKITTRSQNRQIDRVMPSTPTQEG